MLWNFVLDKDKKKYHTILKEVINLWGEENKFPVHYFTRLAYKKDAPDCNSFISFSTISKLQISRVLHTQYTVKTLENKIKFNEFCCKNSIPTPELLGYIKNKRFVSKGTNQNLYKKDDLISIIGELIKVSKTKSIFLKPVDGLQGKGCYKIGSDDLYNYQKINKLFKDILSAKYTYIVQETIIQHSKLDVINPYSVNTIRIDTYIGESGDVEILSALMRFGRKGSDVDNASSSGGGIHIFKFKSGQIGGIWDAVFEFRQ